MPRALLFLLVPALALVAMGRAQADDAEIPVGVTPSGDPNTRAIFRNELTEVDLTDQHGTASDFDGLSKGTVNSGSGLSVRQQFGDQFLFTGRTSVGLAQNSGTPAAGTAGNTVQNFQGQTATNQDTLNQTLSTDMSWNATWNASDALSFSYASSSDSELDDDRVLSQELSSDQTFSAKWKAGEKTTLSLSNDQEKSYDWGTTGYDRYGTTALTLSQKLSPNVTWNTAPAWLQNSSGGTDPYRLTGPQLSTSFDWTPVTGTKWTFGGAVNRLAETDPWSTGVTEQTTRSFFVAYDRALSKNLHVQLRSDYSNLDAPRATAANAAQQEQVSLHAGQRYSLTDTLSARFDMSQIFQQQDHQAWATSDSMATLSMQKNF